MSCKLGIMSAPRAAESQLKEQRGDWVASIPSRTRRLDRAIVLSVSMLPRKGRKDLRSLAHLGVVSSMVSLLIRQRLQLLADAVDKASLAVLVALMSSDSANVLGVNRTRSCSCCFGRPCRISSSSCFGRCSSLMHAS